MKTGFLPLAAAASLLGTAIPASAATTVPLFWGSGPTLNNNAIRIDNGDVKIQVTAWNTTSTNLASSAARSRGTLGLWDFGLGATYSGDGNHTVDNAGRYDFLLIQFDKAVALNTVTFTSGWDNKYDSDATISRANVNYGAFGGSYQSVGTSFWNAAGSQLNANKYASDTPDNNFTRGVVNTSRRQVNPTLATSNVWIVAARIGNLDTFSDGFKVKGFTYVDPFGPEDTAVPEPGTWALLILGFGVIGGSMRRKVRTRLTYA